MSLKFEKNNERRYRQNNSNSTTFKRTKDCLSERERMTAYNEMGLLPVEMCSTLIDEQNYRIHPWSLPNNASVKYADVINYSRRYCLDQEAHNCVMCGKHNVIIPSQNKDVCKTCDSNCWYNSKLNVVFKFCKGCKNFFSLEEFREKPEASKCGKCRKRGRENYINKKLESGYLISESLSPRDAPDSHIIGEDYCSSGCTSVATVIEEEGVEGSPSVPLSQENVSLTQKNSQFLQRRPPKVPKRSSPCSDARSALMNGYGTPCGYGSSSGSDSEAGSSVGRSRADSITQLIACSEQLDENCLIIPNCVVSTESLYKKQRLMAMMHAQQRTPKTNDVINVVTPSTAPSYFQSMTTTASSPISSLHLFVNASSAATPPSVEEGIRGASPVRSILKGQPACGVKTESEPEGVKAGEVVRSRQVSFGSDSICSPPSSAASPTSSEVVADWCWDPTANPLLNLAALVSTAKAEKV